MKRTANKTPTLGSTKQIRNKKIYKINWIRERARDIFQFRPYQDGGRFELKRNRKTKWSLFMFFVRFAERFIVILFSVVRLFWLLILCHFLGVRCVLWIARMATGNVNRFMNDILPRNKTKLLLLLPKSYREKYEWIIANHKFVLDSVALVVVHNYSDREFRANFRICFRAVSRSLDSFRAIVCFYSNGELRYANRNFATQIIVAGMSRRRIAFVWFFWFRLPDIRTIWSDIHVWSMWISCAHKTLVRILCTCFVHSMTSMTILRNEKKTEKKLVCWLLMRLDWNLMRSNLVRFYPGRSCAKSSISHFTFGSFANVIASCSTYIKLLDYYKAHWLHRTVSRAH